MARAVGTAIGGCMADRELPDGRIERTDPRTGRVHVVSRADNVRTQLTRERDQELSMQAGAPPIAQRPLVLPSTSAVQPEGFTDLNRYRGDNRAGNVARAKADGQFDAKRAEFNAANRARGLEMDDQGNPRTIGAALTMPPPSAAAPTQPTAQASAPATTGPINATPDMVSAAPRGTVAMGRPTTAGVTAAAASQPAPAAAVAAPQRGDLYGNISAAGPNISTAPTGLPQGSIGAQRSNGTYMVNTADGKTQSFANEAAARDYYGKLSGRPQAAQEAEQFLATRAPAAMPSTGSAVAAPPVVDMASKPAPTPVNSIGARVSPSSPSTAPRGRGIQPTLPVPLGGNPPAPLVLPAANRAAAAAAEVKRRTKSDFNITVPGRALRMPNLDAGAVPMPGSQPEPFDFPSLGPAGSRRPRASLA